MGERKVPGGGLTVAAVFAAVLAACSGYGAHGGDAGHRGERAAAPAPRLSVAALRKKAAAAGRECPVAYRPGAALRAAGVRGEAARVEGGSVLGELPDGPDEPLTRARGALVDCGYRLGGERARLFTVGVRKGYAVAVLLPQIQHDARLTMDQLRRFARQARDAEPGRPLLAPGGNVAAVRLPGAGDGDVALVVTLGEGRTRLSGRQVATLADRLAEQAPGGDAAGAASTRKSHR